MAPKMNHPLDRAKLDTVSSSLRNHACSVKGLANVRPKEGYSSSKRPLRSPMASKTDAKRHKADYPTPIPRVLLAQPAIKCMEVRKDKLADAVKPNFSEVLAKPAPFLHLPAEIRWQIYQYLFEPHRVEILRCKGKNPDPSRPIRYRLYHRQQKPRSPSTQAMHSSGYHIRRTSLLFNLVFTCRTIYCETIFLVYSTAQFIFNSTNSIVRFLSTTSEDAQAAIRHIELNHIMYNEPRLTAFRQYKIRSDIAWYNACDEIATTCVSLKVLHVKLAIYDWPIRLEIGELWSMPLLLFGHYDGGLDYAGIQLQMTRFNSESLRIVARALEQKLMKPKMFQIWEDERPAKDLMGPVKARKVLRLVV